MGLFGGDGGYSDAITGIDKNRTLYDQLQLPEYDEYIPELYNPESSKYELTSEDPVTKSAQLAALKKMSGLADNGLSDVDAEGFAKARNEGDQMARSGTQAAMADAQNRGVGGSGMEFAMREIANQGGAQRAQDAGLATASDSARQRAMYQQAYGQELGNQRSQDLAAKSANTNIINAFNNANTTNRNTAALTNANSKNQAFQYNQGLKDKNYQNQLGRADRIAGFNNQETSAQLAREQADEAKRKQMGGLVGAGLGAWASGGSPQGASAGYSVGSSIG